MRLYKYILCLALLAATSIEVCLGEKSLGELCNTDDDCPVEHSVCYSGYTDGRPSDCRCVGGYGEDPTWTRCLRFAREVGDPCENDYQCYAYLGYWDKAVCVNNFCVCATPFIPNVNRDECVEPTRIGESCSREDECVGTPWHSSTCDASGSCSCRSGFVPSANQTDCLPLAKSLGAQCSEPQQCQQGPPGEFSDCVYSNLLETTVCSCVENAVAFTNQCLRKAEFVTDSCKINYQCFANIKHGHCLNQRCKCIAPFVPSPDSRKCEE